MFLMIFDLRSSIELKFSIAAYPVCSLNIDFALAKIEGSGEMPHYATSHLGLPCLHKYPFSILWVL